MFEKGKYYLYFTINIEDQVILECNEKPEVSNMPLPDFFQEYLSKDKVLIIDNDYSFKFFQSFVLGNEASEAYTFPTVDENISIRFARYVKDPKTVVCSLFRQQKMENEDLIFNKDYLTGVFTRGAFTVLVNQRLKELISDRSALIVIDLDNFKTVNDSFGHATGDACLKEMARKISDVTQEEILGRFGGDEFLVFVERADKRKINELLKQLLKIEYVLPTKFSKPIKVTCSVGVSYIDDSLKDFKKLFEQADKALYKAKNVEKNCACIYDSGLYFVQPNSEKTNNGIDIKKSIDMIKESQSWLFREEMKHRRNINIGITIVSTILFFIAAYIFGSFYSNHLEKTTKSEAFGIMGDISGQASQNIASNIDSWIDQLTIADAIMQQINSDDNHEYALNETLKLLDGKVSFDYITLLLDDGSLYFSNSEKYNLSTDQTIVNALSGEETVGLININEEELILFSIPYECIHKSNTDDITNHIVGIVGLVEPKSFTELLYSQTFDGESYLAIVRSNGDRIVTSSNYEEDEYTPPNIFDTFDNYALESQAKKIREDMEVGKTDIVEITVGENTYFAYYKSIDVKDWRILIMVNSNYILDDITASYNDIKMITYALLLLLTLMLIVSVTIISNLLTKNLVLTYTDPLTSNINEERFKIDAQKLIQRNKTQYAICYCDISHFKYLNEVLGSAVADKFLKDLYKVIEKELTKNELLSHVFADRYLMLLEYDSVERLHNRLKDISLNVNKTFNQQSINVKLVIGVYLITGNKYEMASCIDRAHDAQKFAKNDFKNNMISFFDESMILNTLEEIEFESDAEVALLDNQFEIYYQLKYDIKNKCWGGSEALVRWIHPKKGLVQPTKFVPLFEKTGFIIKLDLYVFKHVCQDLRKMLDMGHPGVVTSFNLSRKHLFYDDFLDKFEIILEEYNIPRHLIEFEVTESMVFDSSILLRDAIEKIHKLGCKCSIDDFGSGYSSLNVLKEFDFDTIKLDRVFFYGINGFDKKSKIVVDSITKLSHKLKKKVVAEGVETDEQINFLDEIGCDYVQGYYYAKPIPFSEYIKKIK